MIENATSSVTRKGYEVGEELIVVDSTLAHSFRVTDVPLLSSPRDFVTQVLRASIDECMLHAPKRRGVAQVLEPGQPQAARGCSLHAAKLICLVIAFG